MSWVAYVGPFPFPWGQAGSRRICGMTRTLAEAGRSVIVGSGEKSNGEYFFLREGEPDGSIQYIGLGESPGKELSVIKKLVHVLYAWGTRTVDWLDALPVKPSHVFVYGGSAQYILRLLPWCRRNNVKLVVDVVEWYDPKQLAGGFFGPFNISAKLALRFLYKKCDGVVAISSLLENYYKSRGCKVIRIPPTLDVRCYMPAAPELPRKPGLLKLIYAGTPGNKDLLGHVINGVCRVDPKGDRISLSVIGINAEQARELLQGDDIPPSVQVLGRMPQTEVAKHVAAADFSVLLREPLRFAHAGFPTKFVESMTNGTPVIANLTSDLGLYLRDGIEGLVCVDHSTEAFAGALSRALNLSPSQLDSMRVASRRQAEASFDFRAYVDSLNEFIFSV